MRVELTRLQKRLNATMIYVTHDQVEAMTMADKIVVLHEGHVEQVGKPLDLYHTPKNRFVAGFIGSPAMNFLEGEIKEVNDQFIEVDLEGGHQATVRREVNGSARQGAPITLGVRPEALSPEGIGDSKIPGKVYAVERLGGETYLYLHTPEGHEITVHAPGDKVVATGDQISIGFTADKCHLFHENGEAFGRLSA
jgi:multiple sugar transport system ATP-binding protein